MDTIVNNVASVGGTQATEAPLLLVTGASGYIGSHIVEPLTRAGYRVRAAARKPASLRASLTGSASEIVAFDAFDFESVRAAVQEVDTGVLPGPHPWRWRRLPRA